MNSLQYPCTEYEFMFIFFYLCLTVATELFGLSYMQ